MGLLVFLLFFVVGSSLELPVGNASGENVTRVLLLTTNEEPSQSSMDKMLTEIGKISNSRVLFHAGKNFSRFSSQFLEEATVLFSWSGDNTSIQEVLERAKNIKWVHCRFAGVDGILSQQLISRNDLILTNGRGTFSASLGEFIVAGVLYWAKDMPRMQRAKRERHWEKFDVIEASKQRLCIVGHGDIGRDIAKKAKLGLEMEVFALRRNPAPRAGDEHVDRVFETSQLHEMIAGCDFVVVAAPLTSETKHMIGQREFEMMKPSAIIMNVGRGPVIDENAMIEALKTKEIRGAFLDVFEVEPLPEESELWDLENVFISAHTADHTRDWMDDAALFFASQIKKFVEGVQLENVVNKAAGY